MATVLLFEDDSRVLDLVPRLLAEGGHEIVGQASTIPEAYMLIKDVYLGKIAANATILDGNLKGGHKDDFRLTVSPPVIPEQTRRQKLLRHVPEPQLNEINVAYSRHRFGCNDARTIVEVMRACNIMMPIIGFSSLSLIQAEIAVTTDLGKTNMHALSSTLDQLSNSALNSMQ
jgi:hypothetical protein